MSSFLPILTSLVVVYGDLFKYMFAPQIALILQYLASLTPLLLLIATPKTPTSLILTTSKESKTLFAASSLLVLAYLLQSIIPTDDPASSIIHGIYMSLPLTYMAILSLKRYNINIYTFATSYLIFFLPVNLIGIIQKFLDSSFFISSSYAPDGLGGVILRNTLSSGFFTRYPSIYASADRYSALALIQFICVLITSRLLQPHSRLLRSWIYFNFISSFLALLISGARARILIALSAVFLVMVTRLVFRLLSAQPPTTFLKLNKAFLTCSILLFLPSFIVFLQSDILDAIPVLHFLGESFLKGDLIDRVSEAVHMSGTTITSNPLGNGLGSISFGKPGEFGLMSLWYESGLFFGIITILLFVTIIYVLFSVSLKYIQSHLLAEAIIVLTILLSLATSLLVGLTSMFEVSSGIAYCLLTPLMLKYGIKSISYSRS